MIAVAFGLFVTNLDLFLSARGYLPLNTLLLFVGFSLVVFGFAAAGRDHRARDRFATGLTMNRLPLILFTLWIIAQVIAAGRAVLSGADVDYSQIFPIFQLLVLCVGVLLAASDPDGRRITGAARLGIVILGASIIYETLFPGALGSTASRSGGVALNANIPGFLIPTMLAVSLDFRRVRLGDVLAILFALVAVTATLSRMGIAMFSVVICVYVFFYLLRGSAEGRLRRFAWTGFAALAIAALVVGSLSFLATSTAASNHEFRDRIATLLGVGQVLEDPYRGPLLNHYVHLASRSPWFGYGSGETLMNATARAPYHFGPHNVYVRIWIDAGIVGLFSYAAFVASLIATGINRRSVSATLVGTLVGLYGLFSHNVTDNKAVLILIGVALAQSAFKAREQ